MVPISAASSPVSAGEAFALGLPERARLLSRAGWVGLLIAVLLVGVNSGVGGLKEFCSVAAVALGMDCLMICTFYTAVLTVMVEVGFASYSSASLYPSLSACWSWGFAVSRM